MQPINEWKTDKNRQNKTYSVGMGRIQRKFGAIIFVIKWVYFIRRSFMLQTINRLFSKSTCYHRCQVGLQRAFYAFQRKQTIFFWQCQFIEVKSARNFKYGLGHSMWTWAKQNRRESEKNVIFDVWVLSMQFPHFSQACPDVRWKIRLKYSLASAVFVRYCQHNGTSFSIVIIDRYEQTTSTQEFCWVFILRCCCCCCCFSCYSVRTLIPSVWHKACDSFVHVMVKRFSVWFYGIGE